MMNYDIFLKAVSSVFKRERTRKIKSAEYVYSYESDVNESFLYYKSTGLNDDKASLARLIMDTYSYLLLDENKGQLKHSAGNNENSLYESISTLQLCVVALVDEKNSKEFDSILNGFDSEKNDSFLMYFHKCICWKFKTERTKEETEAVSGISYYSKRKLKKLNAVSENLFDKKAYLCTDDELQHICDVINQSNENANLTIKKIKKIIASSTVILVYDDADEDDEGNSVSIWDYISDDSDFPTTDSRVITLDDIYRTLSEMDVTDTNRKYFSVYVMYNFIKSECKKDTNLISLSYTAFRNIAVWLSEDEKDATDMVFDYILREIGKGNKLPKTEDIAKDIFHLNSSSQFNYSTKIIVSEIRKKLNYIRKKSK